MPSDVPDIAHIARLARATAMPWLPVLHSEEGDRKFHMRRVLPETDDIVRVAEVKGVVAGFIIYTSEWVDHLYIHPDHWFTGLGSRLLLHAQNQSNNLQLWVFERNLAAQKFYLRRGLLAEERTDGSGNEEKCADVRMRWAKAKSSK